MITNFTAKLMGSRTLEIDLKMKNAMINIRKLSLSAAYDTYLVQSISLGFMPEQHRNIQRLLRLWENSPILDKVKKSFFQISGLTAEIMTLENLKLYFYDFLEM